MTSTLGVPYRTLGRTGESVSLVGLGGGHLGVQSDEDANVSIIRAAIDGGINFMDNSWDRNARTSSWRTRSTGERGGQLHVQEHQDTVQLGTACD